MTIYILPADTGEETGYIAGLPVLVMLDPDTSDPKVVIDLNSQESVKLWVLNRLHIFVSKDQKTWRRCFGEYDGCLSDLKPRYHPRYGRYRRPRPLGTKSKNYIYFTSILGSEADQKKSIETFGITIEPSSMSKLSPGQVKRPYPDECSEAVFSQQPFAKGITVLKIPSGDVKYATVDLLLEYWEEFIYTNSLDETIDGFRLRQRLGTLTPSEIQEEETPAESGAVPKRSIVLKPYLKLKSGQMWAQLNQHSMIQDSEVLAPSGYIPKAGRHYFVFGRSKDSIKKIAEEKLPSEDVIGTIQLNVLLEARAVKELWNTDTWGNNPGYVFFPTRPLHFEANPSPFRQLNDNIVNYMLTFFSQLIWEMSYKAPTLVHKPEEDLENLSKHVSELIKRDAVVGALNSEMLGNYLIGKLNSYLDGQAPNDECKSCWRMVFQAAPGPEIMVATMMAFNNLVAQQQILISQSALDILKSGDKDPYLYSVMRVFFATGSDGFSDALVPMHVYFQLKSWWDSLDSVDPSVKEGLKDSDEIEVLGFSSRLTSETDQRDNERLRKDRAWKTAKSLQLLLQNDKAYLADSGSSQSGKLRIKHRPAPLNFYPDDKIFNKFEMHFAETVLDGTKVEFPQTRTLDDNRHEDRVALVVFKRKMPKFSQLATNVIVTDYALPIYEYRTLLHVESGGNRTEDVVLLYACPGELFDKKTR
jgi:hypothetical protein